MDTDVFSLERENNQIIDSWRLFLQPDSILKIFINEEEMHRLNNQSERPTLEDLTFGVTMETVRLGIYTSGLITVGYFIYKLIA
ncbi:MAG: hypothetical protein AABX66_01445 [Nanoarchaeota archaeon]